MANEWSMGSPRNRVDNAGTPADGDRKTAPAIDIAFPTPTLRRTFCAAIAARTGSVHVNRAAKSWNCIVSWCEPANPSWSTYV
jgi:hypothetical protein